MQSLSRVSVIAGSLFALSVWSLGASAQVVVPSSGPQVVKLSGTLAQPGSSDVLDFLLSPDGARVLYRSDQLVDNFYDLFSTPADGSTATVMLNDPLVAGGNVGGQAINIFGAGGRVDYAVAPGSGRVVYVADQDTNDVDELFSVPGDRSASPVRLNGDLPLGQDVMGFWITPDGQLVIFQAGTFASSALFRVPTDGSAPAVAVTGYSNKSSVWLGPDGSTVVYAEPDQFGIQTSLYRVPTNGSAAPTFIVESAPPLSFGFTYFGELTFSDDGTRVVFAQLFDEDGLEQSDLLTASLDGSYAPRYLNLQPLDGYVRPYVYDGDDRVVFIEGGGVVAISLDGSQRVVLDPAGWNPAGLLVLSNDGTRVVFSAGQVGQGGLFQAPIDGSQAALQLVSSSASILAARFAGSTVVYSAWEYFASGPHWKHWAVPLAGGQAPAQLNPPPYDDAAGDVVIHPGGQDVLFRAAPGGLGVHNLYRVPLDASAPPQRLNTPLEASGDVSAFAVAGSGDTIAYLADAQENETFELFGAPFAGGPVLTYNAPLASGPVLGDVLSFWVSADEQRVVYRADQDTDGIFGLFNRASGRGAPFSLTSGLPEAQTVFADIALSPDGTRAAFLQANSPGSAAGWLYAADTTQPSLPILLDDENIHATPLLISSQGTRVVYRRSSLFGPYVLCSARLDGVGQPLSLTPVTGTVTQFKLSEDGSQAFYLAALDVSGVIELHHVPLDGSAPSAKLNPPLAGNSDVTAFASAPGGLHVVYIADADLDEQFELYAVPSDGSAPAVELNAPLVAGGDVSDFAITSDGAYVLYRADQSVDQRFELFRVPITGGTPILLTSVAGGIGVHAAYALSADAQTVYYRATHTAPTLVELFRVAADGSASPVRISGTMIAGGGVSAFALAPDQVHLVYAADQRTDGVVELFGVNPTPGTDVLLHALPASGDVISFRIAPDSRAVVYRADPVDGVFELFTAPLDGSAAPSRLNLPLPIGGDVEADFVALSSGFALYRADQEEDGVLELFSAFHGPRVRSAKPKR